MAAPTIPISSSSGMRVLETGEFERVDIDAGDVVITSVRWRGEGKESGLAIDNRQYDAFEFRDGKIVKAVLGYRSRAEALEAAGLSE